VDDESEDGVANANPLDGAKEIQAMLKDYAIQETVDPLKSLGRFLAWGISGAIMVFLGVFFIGLGLLRLLQGSFDGGNYGSLIPYLASIGVLIVAMVIIVALFSRSKKRVLS
jgi:hypothetical protein